MRRAPKYAVGAANNMSPHVVQPWRSPRQTIAFSKREFGTGSREIIAEHVSKRARGNVRGIVTRSSHGDCARRVTTWRDEHRRTVLCHLIKQAHGVSGIVVRIWP
jgi:hypothetical protein